MPESKSGATGVDPRIEQSRRIIGEAALMEFAERGFAGMTIEGVASRAGVGKSTIYRHWRTKIELIDDALRLLPAPQASEDDEGLSGRDQVINFLVELEQILNQSRWGQVLPAMVQASELFDDVAAIQRRFGSERRDVLEQILIEAVARDELSAELDISVLARCLVGPVFLARLMQHERLSSEMIVRIVDQQLR